MRGGFLRYQAQSIARLARNFVSALCLSFPLLSLTFLAWLLATEPCVIFPIFYSIPLEALLPSIHLRLSVLVIAFPCSNNWSSLAVGTPFLLFLSLQSILTSLLRVSTVVSLNIDFRTYSRHSILARRISGSLCAVSRGL